MAAPPDDITRSVSTPSAVTYRFSPADEQLLDEVQRGCFDYFWKETLPPAYVARDRLKSPVASVAAVGFQLSGLVIGVERGWITRAHGEERTLAILNGLMERKDNHRYGMYLHFVDRATGGLSSTNYEVLASTIDTALLIAGAIPAGEYFGGPVKERVDRLVAEADWRAFVVQPENVICMGWQPADKDHMDGPGHFHRGRWTISSAEEHLVYWLAVGSPVAEHAVPPELYYRLERKVGRHDDMPPFVMSWSGTMFHFFFDHCWIDYRSLGADDPRAFGVDLPRVDWFENSRRAALTYRRRCIEARDRFHTFSENIWGLSACAGRDGYLVPGLRPNLANEDKWDDGTVAPYAAASCIMFTPAESMAAIRAMRELRGKDGTPSAWRERSAGGYGFVDSFNLDQNFASDDYVGIDEGPMLLAIENARTGLIWRLFMQHPASKLACSRLKLRALPNRQGA
ncbi:MAG TPA: glucoamylase family protein [Phycisphaerae bacterium]|nr:glucoamylase family protein [Phycisphaerae bacterium]